MPPIATLTADGVRIITLRGSVSEVDAAHLRTMLVQAIWHERPACVLVEVGADVLMDSTAVGALVAATEIAGDQRVRLDIRCDDPELRSRLQALGARMVANSEQP
jgi:anti-anti-sigma regulatory factor